jgi:hypothetical protein
MATRIALHVQSNKDQVMSILVEWLKSVHQTISVNAADQTDFPFELYREKFLISEDEPTMLAICQTQPDWVTVHYNSFYNMGDVAPDVSDRLECLAIVAMMQSTADANYLLIHDRGKHLRTLECVAGEWKKQEGEPLYFEAYPLGRKIGREGEEPNYAFSDYEVETYCENFGLELWSEETSNWTVLNAGDTVSKQLSSGDRVLLHSQKPSLVSRIMRLLDLSLS